MGTTRRRFERFLANPSSIGYAVAAITSFTVVAVVLGAVVVYVFDRSEYPTLGNALWFTLQTVTTVGYGDVTPVEPVGRIVASIVMLTSIGLITVITAAVTSTFVAAASRRNARTPEADPDDIRRGIDELAARLDRIERALDLPSGSDASEGDR
jgi:voltage-gated potassium channel